MMFRVTLRAAAVAAFMGVCCSPPIARAADDATTVLARHAAYVGQPQGLALTYRYTPSSRSTAAPAPKPGATPAPAFPPAVLNVYRRGALYREVYEHGGVTSQNGFTGRAFWSANPNGYTVIDLEDTAREMLTSNVIDGDLFGGSIDARSRGAQTIDGTAVDVVRITPASGTPADIAFDRATGAYVRVTYDPENRYAGGSVRIDGYTEVAPGIRVPSGYHSSDAGRWTLAEHAVRTVTNEELRGPVPTATWNFASTDATPMAVVEHQTPYSFLPRGQAVHVRATIGGKTGTFLLDSGASGIILYRPYADNVGLTLLGRTGFSGVNGDAIAARYARAASITVGPNTLSNVIVNVADGKYSEGLDGILGYDFLAGALVDVDTSAQTIRILDPSAYQPTVAKGAFAFPVNLASRQPEIALKAGGVMTRAIFDTGDDFLLVLSDDLQRSGRLVALNATLLVGGVPEDVQIGFFGVDGPSNIPARCSRLNQVEVGPYRYQNVQTCFGPANVFGRDGGLIGFDFLRHFNWTFDYPEAKLVLTPNGK